MGQVTAEYLISAFLSFQTVPLPKIGPAIKLHIRRFDQNGFGLVHARRFIVDLPANVPAKTI
jgi:hypothetical protein